MGQVFKARQVRMDRVIALKIIRKDRQAQFQAVRRFQREAKAAGRLSHPHIVAFHEADVAGEVHFLTMEYVEGTDLARLVERDGPLPVGRACDCVRQAALGLQHAHERGLVHRDIKPSNLLLGSDGVVKILDMGLARLEQGSHAEHASSELTQTGAVMGTPAYMAPEQALDPRRTDIRADIYSLGCTFYYLLTGRVPFVHISMTQALLQHQLEEPAALEQLRPEVPADLATVVRRMMAKRREDRYQTAGEVAATVGPFCCPDGQAPAKSTLRVAGEGELGCAAAGAASSPSDVAGNPLVKGSAGVAALPASRQPAGNRIPSHRHMFLRPAGKGCSLTLAIMSIILMIVGGLWWRAKQAPPAFESVRQHVRGWVEKGEFRKALDELETEQGDRLSEDQKAGLHQEVREAWLGGVEEVAREDKRQALILLAQFLQAQPFRNDPAGLARLYQGMDEFIDTSLEKGQFGKALDELDTGQGRHLNEVQKAALRDRVRSAWLARVDALASEDKRRALVLLEQFLQSEPFRDDPEAITRRDRIITGMIDAIIRDGEGKVGNLLASGRAALDEGLVDVAAKVLEEARRRPEIERDPRQLEALGHAQEYMAWVLGQTAMYEKAALAFGKAIVLRPQEPRYRIDRGRVQYRWAMYGGNKDPQCLADAEADLRAALGLKPQAVDEAQAHDLLGMAALLRGNHRELCDEFTRAADLVDAASAASTAYALDWMREVRRGTVRKAPSAEAAAVLAEAVRQRSRKIRYVAGFEMAAGVLAGWSYELEDKPQEALETYTSLLPPKPENWNPSHLDAILARGDLRLAARFIDRLKPDYQAVAAEADDAVRLADGDSVPKALKARAHAFAGEAWKSWGDQPATAREKMPRYEKSMDYLRTAIRLAPGDPDCCIWRVVLASEIVYFLRKNIWDAATWNKHYQEAAGQIKEALKTDRKDVRAGIRVVQDDLEQLRK
jgi:tRNA A-37 threonylcarbamoyl transferase component Bud32/tetratricopeptide (TPR) repeat protein